MEARMLGTFDTLRKQEYMCQLHVVFEFLFLSTFSGGQRVLFDDVRGVHSGLTFEWREWAVVHVLAERFPRASLLCSIRFECLERWNGRLRLSRSSSSIQSSASITGLWRIFLGTEIGLLDGGEKPLLSVSLTLTGHGSQRVVLSEMVSVFDAPTERSIPSVVKVHEMTARNAPYFQCC